MGGGGGGRKKTLLARTRARRESPGRRTGRGTGRLRLRPRRRPRDNMTDKPAAVGRPGGRRTPASGRSGADAANAPASGKNAAEIARRGRVCREKPSQVCGQSRAAATDLQRADRVCACARAYVRRTESACARERDGKKIARARARGRDTKATGARRCCQ